MCYAIRNGNKYFTHESNAVECMPMRNSSRWEILLLRAAGATSRVDVRNIVLIANRESKWNRLESEKCHSFGQFGAGICGIIFNWTRVNYAVNVRSADGALLCILQPYSPQCVSPRHLVDSSRLFVLVRENAHIFLVHIFLAPRINRIDRRKFYGERARTTTQLRRKFYRRDKITKSDSH